jgi:hypothetical protein
MATPDTRVITKEGKVTVYNAVCKHCATEYSYTIGDVKSGKIACPLCEIKEVHTIAMKGKPVMPWN